MSYPDKQLGWKAKLDLTFKKTQGKTALTSRSQFGPLTVQRPFYPEADVCHLYLLHPPGGVVGGDKLQINVNLEEQSNVLLTTPGATKFYRSSGKLAQQTQTLSVADGCTLEWLPQENIFFDKTHSQLSTRVELEKSAHFMGWEINCYGRPASKELFENGKVTTSLEIFRNGSPLLLDRLVIDSMYALQSPVCLNGYASFGTFVATSVTKESLDKARAAIKNTGIEQQTALTLIDDILVARCLSNSTEQISTTLKLIWSALRADVIGREACYPRIWLT